MIFIIFTLTYILLHVNDLQRLHARSVATWPPRRLPPVEPPAVVVVTTVPAPLQTGTLALL